MQYAPLFSLPVLSSKLDSHVIKILDRHSLKLKKSALQCFDAGESNLNERSGQLIRGAHILKLLVTKLVL